MSKTEEVFNYFLKLLKIELNDEFTTERSKVAALLTIATRLEELDVDIDRIGRNK
jgi:hypothetical protein